VSLLNDKHTVCTGLVKALRDASVFNPEVQVAPACIIWPDRDRQWEAIVPRLQNELPELLALGNYKPENRTGPAIWLRCVIAGKVEDVDLPANKPPIFYLPGVSRQDLRAVESCPDHLKPLAELQYRGVIWSQINAKDWTILAFLKSDQGGLGLDVAQDNDAKNAMQLAIYRLLDEEMELLKGRRLDKDYFNTLLTGGDPVRDLLQWLDQETAFQGSRGKNEWKAFVEICKSQLVFNPQKEGVLAGATKLAAREGPWQAVWERFRESPKRYPNIPLQIRKCPMPPTDLFSNADTHGGWPQWNDEQEKVLCAELNSLQNMPSHEVRKQIMDLNLKHNDRQKLVWTDLGETPLACALEHLTILAETTINTLAAGTAEEVAAGYTTYGWRADDAVLRALACANKKQEYDAISIVVRSVYMPWVEESARHLQKIVSQSKYPGKTISNQTPWQKSTGECVLFIDGLRFDVARRLIEQLSQQGYSIEEKTSWSALPSITATGKPAATPVREKIYGEQVGIDFEPSIAETGQSLKGGYPLKKLLSETGWTVLEKSSDGDGSNNAWCEFGNIDHEGHDRGWKLAKYLDDMLKEIIDRIERLFAAGWKSIRIVTDHGWLLLPGGLPKINLPSSLTESKWGRCAVIKAGAITDEKLYPWYWNPDQSFALADGISCYRAGEEFAHGGLSLQECLILELTVSSGTAGQSFTPFEITDVVWKGLRCTVVVDGEFSDLSLDVRTQPGNSSSSIVVSVKQFKENGTVSVIVENEELEGKDATIVLLDPDGGLVAQIQTSIGGGNK